MRGTSLSVGYYANEEKTNAAFVQNPLNPYYEEKIYRTGDLAHYNEFGEIMFDGRKDFQIKHMGYRIELGEIETAILSIEEIDNACCLYDEERKRIVSVFQSKQGIDGLAIRKRLMSILPKYMIPSEYFAVEKMPLNDNGKINRKQLKTIYLVRENEYALCEKSGDIRNSCCYAVYCRTLEERPHTCCGQRLFEWMYVQGEELNFNLAVDDETGEILGINGFILYNHEVNPDMSGSMWKVLPNQSPALGLSLGEYSWMRWQPRDVFSLGLNERAAKIEHLYGSETACLECWYRLGKERWI